ncbi:MAG TPA: plastocyanin/azurin family copper-binding protein [Chloroflexota bacterium]|nr:plastocyanin/azurin family copper-binding protein [Chloroflexota bacterium]
MSYLTSFTSTDGRRGSLVRRQFLAGLALVGAGAVVACGGGGSAQTSNNSSAATAVARVSTGMNTLAGAAQSANPIVVQMTGQNTFVPATLTVAPGATVTWQNDASTPQSATFDPAKALTKGDIALPQGAQPFNSNLIQPKQTWSHTFTMPGTYQYIGMPNEALGMRGTIVVTQPASKPAG